MYGVVQRVYMRDSDVSVTLWPLQKGSYKVDTGFARFVQHVAILQMGGFAPRRA